VRCRIEPALERVDVRFGVADVVVSGQHAHDRVFIEPLQVRRRPTDTRCRISSNGLGENLMRL